MSNDPYGRRLTTRLNGYWKNHPGQRDFVHGTYHAGAGVLLGGVGLMHYSLYNNGNQRFSNQFFDRSRADFERTRDHWFRGENRNDRKNYNPSPQRQCNIFW